MLTRAQILGIYWYLRRRRPHYRSRRRYYIRPAHQANLQDSFIIFQRYYESNDSRDLSQFCRFTPVQFDALYEHVQHQLSSHSTTHRRPITGRQRLAVFLR